MSAVQRIAREEWRQWSRSRLAWVSSALLLLVLISTAVLTLLQVTQETASRDALQRQAHDTFLSQPARHPHRMVHYGHYVFRSPSPLAAFDPGLEPVTGQTLFLEGHRQNAAMFAAAATGARLGGLPALSPAVIYQLFVPLLLIVLGYGAVARERESATLVPLLMQRVSGGTLIAGKLWALGAAALLLTLPVAVIGLWATVAGDSGWAALGVTALCAVYLLAWCAIIVAVSAACRSRHAALAALAALWIAAALVIPAVAVDAAARAHPVAGKIDADLRMLADLRAVGDGHDAGAPAFARLRAELLERYRVDRPEDLPVNLRGVVAQHAEAEQKRVLDGYAAGQMTGEAAQARVARRFGWLSPVVAFATASRALAGTDLDNHHRFLREAEALRFSFVQALNRIHAEQLVYTDDIARSRDVDAERRTRVDPSAWRVLEDFRFGPTSAAARLQAAAPALLMLLCWLLLPLAGCAWSARRLETSP